jgi:hypothetical protein
VETQKQFPNENLQVISERRAAAMLGLSSITLRRARLAGRINALVAPGLVRYSATELDRFREEHLPEIERQRDKLGWGRTRFAQCELYAESPITQQRNQRRNQSDVQ